jgi:hypothetical protein
LGTLAEVLGHPGQLLRRLGGGLGKVLGFLGQVWRHLGDVSDQLGKCCARFWEMLGVFRGVRGTRGMQNIGIHLFFKHFLISMV